MSLDLLIHYGLCRMFILHSGHFMSFWMVLIPSCVNLYICLPPWPSNLWIFSLRVFFEDAVKIVGDSQTCDRPGCHWRCECSNPSDLYGLGASIDNQQLLSVSEMKQPKRMGPKQYLPQSSLGNGHVWPDSLIKMIQQLGSILTNLASTIDRYIDLVSRFL